MPESMFESIERFREMLSATTTMCAAIDKQFVFLHGNEEYANCWGTNVNKLIGQQVKRVLDPESFEKSLPYFKAALNGETVDFDLEFYEGRRVVVLANRLVPFYEGADKSGPADGFYLFATDTTGQHVSQQVLSLVLASAPGYIFLVDRDYRITYANRKCHDGFPDATELKGLLLQEFIGQSRWQADKTYLDQALAGNFVRYRPKAESKEGLVSNKMVYLIPDVTKRCGEVVGFYCLSFEESELELGRPRLRQRARNVDLALQGHMVGIWERDPQKEDWLLTEHIEQVLGMAKGELANSESLTLKRIHKDDLPKVLENRRRHVDTGQTYINEFRMLDKSGEHRWLRTIGRSELDNDGKSIYTAGTVTDINALKEAELLAAEQVKHRDSFLSMLSHELRNPVAAIKYAIDALAQPTNPPVEQSSEHQNSLAIIARQTNVISRLLKDLLNVNRVTSNQISFENTELCLVKLIREIVEISQPKFAEKKQQLTFVSSIPQFRISGDEVRLHQVFSNLLDNASKYSAEKTEIQISCWHDPQDGRFVAMVSDQGKGVPSKFQRSVFELFFQQDPALDRAEGGLGVGLFLVKRIVEAHQGTVTVKSPGANGGSDFIVQLPSTQIEALPVANRDDESAGLRKMVLVEDNDDSRVALSLALSSRGFEVQAFADGETALENIPRLKPEIALIDIGLPRMDGMSLMRELRQDETLNSTVFVALTGYGQSHERAAILDAGFNHHLVKPLELADLFAIIAQNSPQGES